MAHFKARDLYRRLTEEIQRTGRPVRCTEDVRHSATLREFSEKGLALDAEGCRIEGKSPQVCLEDFSVRDLAAMLIRNRSNGESVGDGFIQEYFRDPQSMMRLHESGEIAAVDYSMFYGITGQLLINSVLKGFTAEKFVFTQTAGTYQTKMVSGERIPGVAEPMDPDSDGTEDTLLHKDGEDYRYFGFGEEYIDLPETEERGGIIGITRLTIFADRTGMVGQQANKVGDILGLRKEKRGLQTLIGLNGYQYKEKRQIDGAPVVIDPYQAAAGSVATQLASTIAVNGYPGGLATRKFPFVNDIPANPLNDYTALKTGDLQFSQVPNPNTGEPIEIGKAFIFAPFTARWQIAQVVKAYEQWKLTQVASSSPYVSGAVNTVGPNLAISVLGDIDSRISRQLRSQLQLALTAVSSGASPDKIWFYGDVADAIKYAENWPITVTQAPPDSEAAFSRDIPIRFKASERGQWIWDNVRAMQRHNYQSQS